MEDMLEAFETGVREGASPERPAILADVLDVFHDSEVAETVVIPLKEEEKCQAEN